MVYQLNPSKKFREELQKRGGASATRCYQCATCSSVCQLAPADSPFPRRQMLFSQWGLEDLLVSDPSIWLCYQCNDCTVACPRDAKPGDVMQIVRAMMVERLSFPRFLGRLVGKAAITWPLLLGVPILFWIGALAAINGLTIPKAPLVFAAFVPHWLIYSVFFPVTGMVFMAIFVGGLRYWRLLGKEKRNGSFLFSFLYSLWDIITHKRFAKCITASSRRWAHFTIFFGFVGAAIDSGLVLAALYILKEELPLSLWHPSKIIGNLSAVLLLFGCTSVSINRLRSNSRLGTSTAYDNFFLVLVLLVVSSGILTEISRLVFLPQIACWIYILHLGVVLCLFVTFPYSKSAHLIYRTLAMTHECMAKLGNSQASELPVAK